LIDIPFLFMANNSILCSNLGNSESQDGIRRPFKIPEIFICTLFSGGESDESPGGGQRGCAALENDAGAAKALTASTIRHRL
jgi:hypothetical protein